MHCLSWLAEMSGAVAAASKRQVIFQHQYGSRPPLVRRTNISNTLYVPGRDALISSHALSLWMRLQLLLLLLIKSEKTLQSFKNFSRASELIGRKARGQGRAEGLWVHAPNEGATRLDHVTVLFLMCPLYSVVNSWGNRCHPFSLGTSQSTVHMWPLVSLTGWLPNPPSSPCSREILP